MPITRNSIPIAVALVVALALWAAPATAGQPDPPASQSAPATALDTARPGCAAADVSSAPFDAAATEEAVCRAEPASDPVPELRKGPPFQRGFCRCGCGTPCETSADCGGASCDRFITCC